MDYIIVKYSMNKDKPQLQCNGKCHLAKQPQMRSVGTTVDNYRQVILDFKNTLRIRDDAVPQAQIKVDIARVFDGNTPVMLADGYREQFNETLPETDGSILNGSLGSEVGYKKFLLGIKYTLPVTQDLFGGNVQSKNLFSLYLNYSI